MRGFQTTVVRPEIAPLRRCLVIILMLAAAAVSGCGADRAQIRVCEQVARAIEQPSRSIEVTHAARHPKVDHAVILDYRVTDTPGEEGTHWISCRFAGGSPATGPRRLVGVTTDREGVLSPVRVAMLQIWLRVSRNGRDVSVDQVRLPEPPIASPAYLVQQLVDAVPLGSAYALIAVGFSLVWGGVARFRFSVGALMTLAGGTAFLAFTLLVIVTADRVVIILAAVLMVTVAAHLAYSGLRRRGIAGGRRRAAAGGIGIATLSVMIATFGLALGAREALWLAGGAGDRWLEPVVTPSRVFFESADFAATISSGHIIIFAIAASAIGCISLIVTESGFGRRYRACHDDIGMTTLAGVDGGRLVNRVFLLGAASVGLAGAILVFCYGTISPFAGVVIVLKALTAAVIGGLGSVGGAAAGGVAIALFETLGAAYLGADYRDLALVGLLAVFLLLRLRRLRNPS